MLFKCHTSNLLIVFFFFIICLPIQFNNLHCGFKFMQPKKKRLNIIYFDHTLCYICVFSIGFIITNLISEFFVYMYNSVDILDILILQPVPSDIVEAESQKQNNGMISESIF